MELTESDRTRLRRHPERALHELAAVEAILDEALYCHIGFLQDGQPVVIPTIHARVGDTLYLHGSPASRMLRELAGGVELCVCVTLVDGIVLARSVYNHSLNYRSAVVFGRARRIGDPAERAAALAAIVEHVAPGRSAEARPPSEQEAAGTLVLALPLGEASAKARSGDPSDFADDLALPVWAGVIPLALVAGPPEPAADLAEGIELPASARSYRRGARAG